MDLKIQGKSLLSSDQNSVFRIRHPKEPAKGDPSEREIRNIRVFISDYDKE
jgi:hypothetical protein